METLFATLHVVAAVFIVGPLAILPMTAMRAIRAGQGQQVDVLARSTFLLSLLSLLVARAGQVVSREDVMAVWQNDAAEPAGVTTSGSNALEVYIHRLRRKLSASTIQIRNVRGLGYTLTAGE